LRIGQQGPTQIVQVINAQVHTHIFAQRLAKAVQTEHIHFVAVQTPYGLHFVTLVLVDQGDFGRFRIVTKQGQIHVTQARGPTLPDRSAQMRAKFGQALHPDPCQLTQGSQLSRLGVGAKQGDVVTHLGLDHIIGGQCRTGGQAQLFEGAVLGRTKSQAFFHHQSRGGGGNFKGNIVHGHRL